MGMAKTTAMRSTVISASVTRILLTCSLLLVCLPTAGMASDDAGEAEGGTRTLEAASAAALLRAFDALPAVIWPDAPAPRSVARFVSAAREQLWHESIEGLRLPLHLRFVEARCEAEGTSVALIFEEYRPPYLVHTYAYAARGSLPASSDDRWAGGTGLRSIEADPELERLLGTDAIACP